jgi:hypothetical protein
MNTKEMQEYAWGWFEYHAGQRLVAFRFFLIFLGVLVLGLGNSLKDGNLTLASAISVAATIVSFAFLMLEIRNEQLVNVGRAALKKLEDSEDFKLASPEVKLFHADDKRSLFVSHKLWFRLIYGLCILVFLFLAFQPTTVLPAIPGRST